MTFVLLTASSTPAPAPSEMEPWEVSPGLLGFLLGFFVLAIAVVPLFRSMAKHMRRVDHNERLRQAAEEEAAARAGAGHVQGSPAGGPAGSPGAAGSPDPASRRNRVVEGGPAGTSADGPGPTGAPGGPTERARPDDAG